MKAILEFNLPEDKLEFDVVVSASDMATGIWDFKQYLRNILKYQTDKYSEDYLKAVEDIQERFFEELGEFEFE